MEARNKIDRDLIIEQEKTQGKLNKTRRRARELRKDLAGFESTYRETKRPEDKRLADLCSAEVKKVEDEIRALERRFAEADKKVNEAILANLAD